MRLRDEASSKAKRERPQDFFRRGVPDGMRKPEADALWAVVRKKAKHIMDKLVDEGVFPEVTVPETLEGKAKAALNEAFVMALGPTEQKVKLGALRTVLDFTMQKPVQKTETKVSAEDFLNDALKDFRNDSPAADGANSAS